MNAQLKIEDNLDITLEEVKQNIDKLNFVSKKE
jgi:hypothetical protein